MGGDNQLRLNSANRLGVLLERGQSFTFSWEGAMHTAQLREGDHPMSFLNLTVRTHGTALLKQLRNDFLVDR